MKQKSISKRARTSDCWRPTLVWAMRAAGSARRKQTPGPQSRRVAAPAPAARTCPAASWPRPAGPSAPTPAAAPAGSPAAARARERARCTAPLGGFTLLPALPLPSADTSASPPLPGGLPCRASCRRCASPRQVGMRADGDTDRAAASRCSLHAIDDLLGQLSAFLVLTVAAAESAIGLAWPRCRAPYLPAGLAPLLRPRALQAGLASGAWRGAGGAPAGPRPRPRPGGCSRPARRRCATRASPPRRPPAA